MPCFFFPSFSPFCHHSDFNSALHFTLTPPSNLNFISLSLSISTSYYALLLCNQVLILITRQVHSAHDPTPSRLSSPLITSPHNISPLSLLILSSYSLLPHFQVSVVPPVYEEMSSGEDSEGEKDERPLTRQELEKRTLKQMTKKQEE
jgi:hypothetical protein